MQKKVQLFGPGDPETIQKAVNDLMAQEDVVYPMCEIRYVGRISVGELLEPRAQVFAHVTYHQLGPEDDDASTT